MSDKNEPIDNNAALLKSLESIKSLLAKSEDKLSAARESLNLANQSPTMKKQKSEQSPKADIEIPTLDEIVEPGQQFEIGLPDEDDIPVLDSIEKEAPIFKLDDEDDYDFGESTMTIDTSSMPFDDEPEDMPIFNFEPTPKPKPEPLAEAEPESIQTRFNIEAEAEAIELPDLTPILNAIDDAEGTMRAQISEAAIAFEEQLNNQLDVQMCKLREQIHLLTDKFGE